MDSTITPLALGVQNAMAFTITTGLTAVAGYYGGPKVQQLVKVCVVPIATNAARVVTSYVMSRLRRRRNRQVSDTNNYLLNLMQRINSLIIYLLYLYFYSIYIFNYLVYSLAIVCTEQGDELNIDHLTGFNIQQHFSSEDLLNIEESHNR
jgi:hypothetical protein